MTCPPIHHLARTMLRVDRGPATLSTIVGAGFAVAVSLRGEPGGGMVHLDPVPAGGCGAGPAAHPPTEELVAALLAELGRLGSVAGAHAEIVGGADVLGLHSPSAREERTAPWVAGLQELLALRGVGVGRTETCGRRSRRVLLQLPSGRVEVQEIGASHGAPARPRPAPLPATPESRPDHRIVVDIGGLAVGRSPSQLVTLLGSCVGVALYDGTTTLGGLAHVMLPRAPGYVTEPGRYADTAVPALVEALVAAGARRSQLKSKIAGGATVLLRDAPQGLRRIPEGNVAAVRQALADARIPLVAERVGGEVGVKMTVDLQNFAVSVRPAGLAAGA